jgi:uncharacterized protein YyaL (SSP411 family)
VNRLAGETSPYLLQHRENPVEWFPWGPEAFARAEERSLPIFLSIGYSACHWCHVMAHESFEDPETADELNAHFVAIKVDREERPDVDAIYMEAAQALTGGGGWPLSVFCTPDGRPFFAGTYYPKHSRGPGPTFLDVLHAVTSAWTTGRAAIDQQADELTAAIGRRLAVPATASRQVAAGDLLAGFVTRYGELFDPEYGGIGTAPKFPQPPMLELVLRAGVDGDTRAAAMTERTLEHLAAGGIYDHLAGGFCRYSVDRTWTVPHFEKMLYDQAGLARVFGHAYAATGDLRWRQVATETASYVLRDLLLPSGAFASAEDADSEGEEGKFAIWTREEVDAVLGDELGPLARTYYGMDGPPNFEGRYIPLRPPGAIERSTSMEEARAALFAARAQRPRPGRDDKVLTEWNGMMISALCELAGICDEDRFLDAAVRAGTFLLDHLRREDGRWLRAHKDGRSQHLGLLADHAWFIDAAVRLAEGTGAAHWLDAATDTADALIALFGADDGGFYSTGSDAEALVVRPRDQYDGVIPAASSIAVDALVRLGAITGEDRYTERAVAALDAVAATVASGPLAFPALIGAAVTLERGPIEIVITGGRRDLVAVARRRYVPGAVVAWGEERGPLFVGREVGPEGGRAYVCVAGTCHNPVGEVADLERAITAATVGSTA